MGRNRNDENHLKLKEGREVNNDQNCLKLRIKTGHNHNVRNHLKLKKG